MSDIVFGNMKAAVVVIRMLQDRFRQAEKQRDEAIARAEFAENERAAAMSRIAELEKDKLANDTSWAACQADRVELQAQVAVMREALRECATALKLMPNLPDAYKRAQQKARLALDPAAGKALAKRVAVLEEVARVASEDDIITNEVQAALAKLARLDSLPRGGAR